MKAVLSWIFGRRFSLPESIALALVAGHGFWRSFIVFFFVCAACSAVRGLLELPGEEA